MTTFTTTITTTASQAPRSAVVHPLNTSKHHQHLGSWAWSKFHYTNTAPTWTWAWWRWATVTVDGCANKRLLSGQSHLRIILHCRYTILSYTMMLYIDLVLSQPWWPLPCAWFWFVSQVWLRARKNLVVSLNPVYRQQPCHYTIWFPVDFTFIVGWFYAWFFIDLITSNFTVWCLDWLDHKTISVLISGAHRSCGADQLFHRWLELNHDLVARWQRSWRLPAWETVQQQHTTTSTTYTHTRPTHTN